MGDIRLFHVIDDSAHELENNPFPYERGLQELFEKHLHALTGIAFLDSEYSTGKRHSRRIDTLGVDEAGRPVVIEYKRSRDENVINQGLDYLDWLDDHQAEFRELVRKKLGEERRVDCRTPRLLCIASEFPRQDTIAARDSRRCIELLRYRRYGDAHIALEWEYGNEETAPRFSPSVSPGRTASKGKITEVAPVPPAPQPPGPSVRTANGDPDYSAYQHWDKADEGIRAPFFRLKMFVESLGSVATEAFQNYIAFKCVAAPSKRQTVARVKFRIRNGGLRVLIREGLLDNIRLEKDDFTRPYSDGREREITIRDEEHFRRAEPLLRAAYENLLRRTSSSHADSDIYPRSPGVSPR